MSTPRRALISGITGMDGSYLADLLIQKGYTVHGLMRRASTFNTGRIDHIYQDPHLEGTRFFLHFADLTDGTALRRAIADAEPDEIYHLGAQSHVRVSFDLAEYTADTVALGTLRLLEAAREIAPTARIYYAGSSEQFGNAPAPQDESTPFAPRSPYACAKVFGWHTAGNYRDGYGMWITRGILFNHEAPRRGETFVTRKIARGVARIALGLQDRLYLGNLDARRDWGWAPEYVEGMWRMLQQPEPDDYVLATGEAHTVREFMDAACGWAGIESERHVEIDARYFRPLEVDHLLGNAAKAERLLGWSARTRFDEIVRLMVAAELEAARDEAAVESDRLRRASA